MKLIEKHTESSCLRPSKTVRHQIMCLLCLQLPGNEAAVDPAQEGCAWLLGDGPGCRLLDSCLWKKKLNAS